MKDYAKIVRDVSFAASAVLLGFIVYRWIHPVVPSGDGTLQSPRKVIVSPPAETWTQPPGARGDPAAEPVVTLELLEQEVGLGSQGYPLWLSPLPSFPLVLLRAGIAGTVEVRLDTGNDGVVREAAIVRSSRAEFEEPVLLAAKRWKFFEVKRPGQAGAPGMTFTYRVNFAFDEK